MPEPFDLVLIDEARANLSQWLSHETHGKNLKTNDAVFRFTFVCARRRLLMGADITVDPAVRDFVTRLVPPDEIEVTLYLWTPARLRRDALCIDDEAKWVRLAGDDLADGKSLVVAFRSRSKLEACLAKWRRCVPADQRQFVAITSKVDRDIARRVLQDVDGFFAKAREDGKTALLAYSPSVTVGVDIQYPVDRVYGNALSKKSCDARTFLQSLNRTRGPVDKCIRLFLGPRPSEAARKFMKSSSLRRRLAQSLHLRGNTNRVFVDRVTGRTRLIDDGVTGVSDAVLRDAVVTLDVEAARSEGNHISDALVRLMQLKGFRMVPDELPEQEEDLEESESDEDELPEITDRALVEATMLAEMRVASPVPDVPECVRQCFVLQQKRKSGEGLEDEDRVKLRIYRTMDRFPGLGRWPNDSDELQRLNEDVYYQLGRALFLRKPAEEVEDRDANAIRRALVQEKAFLYNIVRDSLAGTARLLGIESGNHEQLLGITVRRSMLDGLDELRPFAHELDNNGYRKVILKNGRGICDSKSSKNYTSNKVLLQGILRQVGYKLGPGKRKRRRITEDNPSGRDLEYPIVRNQDVWGYEFAHRHSLQ
jgi:hypothetical protein